MVTRKLNEVYTGYDFQTLKSLIYNIYIDLNYLLEYRDFFNEIKLKEIKKNMINIKKIINILKNNYDITDDIYYNKNNVIINLKEHEKNLISNVFEIEEMYHEMVSNIWKKEILNNKNKVLLHMLNYEDAELTIKKISDNEGYISTSYVNFNEKQRIINNDRRVGLTFNVEKNTFLGASELDGWVFLKPKKDNIFQLMNYEFLKIYDKQIKIYAGLLNYERSPIFTKIKCPNALDNQKEVYNEVTLLRNNLKPTSIIYYNRDDEYFYNCSYDCALNLSKHYNVPLLIKKERDIKK